MGPPHRRRRAVRRPVAAGFVSNSLTVEEEQLERRGPDLQLGVELHRRSTSRAILSHGGGAAGVRVEARCASPRPSSTQAQHLPSHRAMQLRGARRVNIWHSSRVARNVAALSGHSDARARGRMCVRHVACKRPLCARPEHCRACRWCVRVRLSNLAAPPPGGGRPPL